MLSETVIEWTKKWKEEGRAQGMAQGVARGRLEVAERMLARGMDIATVAELTGIPVEELKSQKPTSVCEPAARYVTSPRPRKRPSRT